MRVLVTGGSGFIGRYLVRELSTRKHSIAVLTKTETELRTLSAANTDAAISYHEAGLDSPEQLAAAIRTIAPEMVVHLAAIALVTHPDQSELYRTNVIGSENLLRALSEWAPSTRIPVLLTSTAGVYGNQSQEVLDETVEPSPANHYSVSKLGMEFIARQYAEKLSIRIVRPFNIIGAGQSDTFVVPKLVKHFALRAASIEMGNTKPLRDYLDVRECARIYADLVAVGSTKQELDIVNVCSGQGTSVEELIQVLGELTGHQPEIVVSPKFVRKNEVWKMIGDNRKLMNMLGTQIRHSTREVLTSMVAAATRAQ
jgi:GDP-6-deoxy-D-talose 4-dehydrogenase